MCTRPKRRDSYLENIELEKILPRLLKISRQKIESFREEPPRMEDVEP